jgi:hypothetical protein
MKKIKAIGTKVDGQPFKVIHAEIFKNDLNNLPKGSYQITVEKRKRKASAEQFGYLYGLVYPLSLIALNQAGYEFTNIDQVDNFWKMLFANKEIINRETGEIMKIPQSKSEFMTIDEMTYCDAIRNYCSEFLASFIPDPDPNWKSNNEL